MQLVNHELTNLMFKNNRDFYDDILNKKFDIRLFRRYLKTNGSIVAFLPFGKIFGKGAIRLLAKWVPNYRARFWWFVVKRHVFKDRN